MKKVSKGPCTLAAGTAPRHPLQTHKGSHDILGHVSIQTTLVVFISELLMIVKQLAPEPNVNIRGLLK